MVKKSKLIISVFMVLLISFLFIYLREKRIYMNKMVKVSGNIETADIHLSFRVSGMIKQLLVDEGDMVKSGDVLAKLDTDELEKIKIQAQASLEAAQYQYELDKADYERAENLFNTGAIPTQKRDEAKTKVDAGKALVEQLKASLGLANVRLGFADLTSPIDGFVLVKSAEQGEVVQPGAAVFTVADLHDVWLTAYINEKDMGRVKINQPVEIKIDTYTDKVYTGRLSFISHEAEFTPKQIQTTEERVKLVYRIKVKVDNPELELKPGMPADGYILIE